VTDQTQSHLGAQQDPTREQASTPQGEAVGIICAVTLMVDEHKRLRVQVFDIDSGLVARAPSQGDHERMAKAYEHWACMRAATQDVQTPLAPPRKRPRIIPASFAFRGKG